MVTEPGRGTSPRIDLARVFSPRTLAYVGASPRNHSARIVRDNARTLGDRMRVRFVNPRYEEILGEPCFASLEALPEAPDCVLVGLAPARVPAIVEAAARLGAASVVIPGGGIVEGGEPARAMQAEVARIARETGIAVIGPNCMGFIDHVAGTSVYIDDVNPWQPVGGVAGIAQSGSVTDAFVQSGDRIGWSRIVSCGAEVALDICDYLAYSLDDPATHSVVLFVEGFKRPERFLALADHALAIGKPIALVKVGRSSQARAAAVAHSGSLAGEDRAMAAALAATGVIRCADLDELLETAELLAGCHRLGRNVGRGRTGIVTVSTGEASLVADIAPSIGLELPAVTADARARLAADLPTLEYVGNPLDPWGADEPERAYASAFEAFADSGAYDVLALVHDSPFRDLPAEVETGTTVAEALVAATAGRPAIMPVLVSLTSGDVSVGIRKPLEAAGGIPYLRGIRAGFGAIPRRAAWEAAWARRAEGDPRRPAWPSIASDRTMVGHDVLAVEAGGPVAMSSKARARPAGADALADPRVDALVDAPARQTLPERESLALVAEAGVAVTASVAVPDADGAVAAATALGMPVALKLDAVGLAHKSDIGGVRLGLVDAGAVRAAATELLGLGAGLGAGLETDTTIRGLLVQPMAPAGIELIAGLVRDPLVGPVVLVGFGGVLAEVLDDVVVRLAPIDEREALAMLDALRGAPILGGTRGRAPVDRAAVAAILVALGRLGVDRPDVLVVDLNPVVASATGALAVDALVVSAS